MYYWLSPYIFITSAGPATPCRLTESPSFGNPLPILSLSLSVTAQGGETSCQTLVYWSQITRHHRLLNFAMFFFLIPFLNPQDISRKSDIRNIWQIILETDFLINQWGEQIQRTYVLITSIYGWLMYFDKIRIGIRIVRIGITNSYFVKI